MENIYIDIMRISSQRLGQDDEGMTFEEVLSALEEIGYKKVESGSGLKLSAFRWWIDCTTTREINEDNTDFNYLMNSDTHLPWDERNTIPVQIRKKRYLQADAFLNYMSYVALQEARFDSKKAKKTAKWALIVTSILALASIIIQIISIFTNN